MRNYYSGYPEMNIDEPEIPTLLIRVELDESKLREAWEEYHPDFKDEEFDLNDTIQREFGWLEASGIYFAGIEKEKKNDN